MTKSKSKKVARGYKSKAGAKHIYFKLETAQLADELAMMFNVSRSTVVEDAIKELAKKYIIL